jgi:hypothetical protein
MNDWIDKIFYFGSPKDGFKVYPDLGPASNVFSGYYSNTETDWILVARKEEEITRYTYVRYGLLTSLVDGRTGSCFGISIDFVNHYFTDLKVFQTEIFESIWGAILADGQLLQAQESSGIVGFRSYDLYDVASYLDEKSKKIREVIQDKKYAPFVRPSYEIPQAGDNPVYGLHPDSSPSALNEYFRTYGTIKLSPNLPIETQSAAERQQEQRDNLEKEVARLTEQLRQKDGELQAVNQRLEKLHGLVKPIFSEFSLKHTIETDSHFGNSRPIGQTYEPRSSANHKGPHSATTIHNPSLKEYKLSTNTKKILVGAAIVFVLLAIISTMYLLSEDGKQEVEKPQTRAPASQPKPTVASPEPITIVRENRKEVGYLNEAVFLEQKSGTTISDETDFKEALTSFLFQFSPEVFGMYNGDKDKLWRQIQESNPNSSRKITQYLKRGPFIIKSNTDQQAMLKGLVIFKSS